MNDRIKRMINRLNVDKYPLCIEKFQIATQTIAESQGEANIIRRAKVFSNVLKNINIFIEDDDLFAGSGASKPMGLEIDYEYGIWTQDEIDSLKQEQYSITPEEEAQLQELNTAFRDKNLVMAMGEVLYENEQFRPFMRSGLILPPWKDKKLGSGGGYAQSGLGLGPGFFLIGVDYEKMLNEGSLKIISQAEQELRKIKDPSHASLEKIDFLKSVVIVHNAVIAFANRYAELAENMTSIEKDPIRKKELERIAEACRWVPAHPARDFFEALQSFWFTFLMVCPSPTSAAGRFDQYMYPFYCQDKAAGKIGDDEVLELLECLRIKDFKLNRVSGKANRKKNAGMAKWHNWTIGGVTSDGKDATNGLTYLLLEAAKETQIPHHTLTLRVHDNTPEDLMQKALEVVRTGLGMPAFVNDNSYISFFLKHGMSLEDSREYIMTGCLDGNIPALSRTVSIGMFVVSLAFDIFMHNGINPNNGDLVGIKSGDPEGMKTYQEFVSAFYKQLEYLLRLAGEKNNVELTVQRQLFPDPFRSSLMKNAIKEGKDILNRKMPFENGSVLCTIGVINVADSLAAVKKLVYDDNKVSMKDLTTALDANWIGYEDMRKLFLKAPKYGNSDDDVDSIAAELYEFIEHTLAKIDTAYGGKMITTAISITSHQPGGALTGATPDGRRKGDILADGSMSPMHGMDRKGPTAIINSACKIDQDSYQATLLNMKFHPSSLKTDEDLKKLSFLIKTYFKNGGKHVQFNVTDKKTLKEAQIAPELHRNLVVRVAGYSAYFTALGKEVQDEVIERTELSLI